MKTILVAAQIDNRKNNNKGIELEGYATPRILLIFPGSVSCTGLMVLRTGHVKTTSPPPPGAIPLFNTWGSSREQMRETGRETNIFWTCQPTNKQTNPTMVSSPSDPSPLHRFQTSSSEGGLWTSEDQPAGDRRFNSETCFLACKLLKW